MLKELSKGQVPVIGYVQCPFRHSSMLRGAENVMRDMFKKRADLEELLEIATTTQIVYAKAVVEAGADNIWLCFFRRLGIWRRYTFSLRAMGTSTGGHPPSCNHA